MPTHDLDTDGDELRERALDLLYGIAVGGLALLGIALLGAWLASPAHAQELAADPVVETARAAVEAAGLPAWAQAIIPALVGALLAALRAWWRADNALATTMRGVDRGNAELVATSQKGAAVVVQESIRSEAIKAGLQSLLKARLARVRGPMPSPTAGPKPLNGAGPGPARPLGGAR